MPTYLIPDCGICDIPHRCHCPRLMAYCRVCVPDSAISIRNAAALAIGSDATKGK
jgi:hypothetical protein